MAGVKYKRHWFIVRNRGEREIRCLLSAFSEDHIKRKTGLKDKDVVIQRAKRWHIAKVFSGLPTFYDYATKYGSEDINAYVTNEFHMKQDGEEKILVKVLS
jgi:hypothetical protein